MKVDLHLHTRVSDGELSPAELTRAAASVGLDAIAITDHDTAEGVREAQAAAAELPIAVVPGIEISTRWGDQELHILGYWIDSGSEAILDHQDRALRRRSERMEEMVARLQGMGIGITFAQVKLAAGPDVRALGRPHLARALHVAGHTRFYGEAFARLIGDGGPAFVAAGFPEPEVAVTTIHAAGGLAVWAHPPLEWFLDGLALMAAWGIDGVECYRPGADPLDVRTLEEATLAGGLFPSGGSDWHGPHRASLGDFSVDARRVGELLSFGGIPL